MPKFLDRPSWYNNGGGTVYGIGCNQSSYSYGSLFYGNGTDSVTQLVAGASGYFLSSSGSSSPPVWRSHNLYQHTVGFRANGNYNSPTSSSDFPMYCSNAFVSFLSTSAMEIDDENDLMFRLIEDVNSSRHTTGFAYLYTDSDFSDMGLNQQGCRAYGNAHIVSNLNMVSAVILKSTCTRTLPASTNYPVSTIYIYPSEVFSDEVMQIL